MARTVYFPDGSHEALFRRIVEDLQFQLDEGDYNLIASLLDITMDEAKDIEIDTLTDVLKEIVDRNSFFGFFKSAAAAMR